MAMLLVVAAIVFGCVQAPRQSDAGWITLLDSSSMGDWIRIGDANWRVVDGAVQADRATQENSFLVSKRSYADFQLRVEFWADADANSGIFLRCADPRNVTPFNSYEVNIFDTRPDPSYGTGAIVEIARVSPMPRAAGRWNTFEITAEGTHLTVVMNGIRTVDARDAKFTSGPIALQYAGGTIRFRKVQIKEL